MNKSMLGLLGFLLLIPLVNAEIEIFTPSDDEVIYANSTIIKWDTNETFSWIAYSIDDGTNTSLAFEGVNASHSFVPTSQISTVLGIVYDDENDTLWVHNDDGDDCYEYWINGSYKGNNFSPGTGSPLAYDFAYNPKNATFTFPRQTDGKIYLYWQNGTLKSSRDGDVYCSKGYGAALVNDYTILLVNCDGTIKRYHAHNLSYIDSNITLLYSEKSIDSDGQFLWATFSSDIESATYKYWLNNGSVENVRINEDQNSLGITQNGTYLWRTEVIDDEVVRYVGHSYSGFGYAGNKTHHFGEIGDYNITIWMNTTSGWQKDEKNFSIIENINATTPDNDENWSYSQIAGQMETFNLTIKTSGGFDSSINFTYTDDLANTSAFTIELMNTTILAGSNQNISLVNITSSSSLISGNYSGYINVSRQENYNFTLIQINVTIATQSGDVDIKNTSWSIAKNTEENIKRYFEIWNKGDYNLTNCEMSLSTTLSVGFSCDKSAFTVSNETNVTVGCTFSDGSAGSDSSPIVSISCIANDQGGYDEDTVFGSISISSTSGGGGGGGGGTKKQCGEYVIYPSQGFSRFGSEGSKTADMILRINNGPEPQQFFGSFKRDLINYCEILESPDDVIPGNGFDKFVLSCIAPNGTIEEHFEIWTNTGCSDSRTILLSSELGPLESIVNWLFGAVSGNLDLGFLVEPINIVGFEVPLGAILLVIILIIIVVVIL